VTKIREIDPPKARKYLEARTRLFERKKCEDQEGDRARAINERFIRVNGSGFRAISLVDCGSLYDKGPLGTTKDFATALRYCSAGKSRPASNKKLELCLQGWLIKKALVEPEKFVALLCLDERFDELQFVADEFNLGAVRADVIALGRKGELWYPVFIELKVRRALKELIGQLDDIRNVVSAALMEPFIDYLEAVSGISAASICLGEATSVLVWPIAMGIESKDVKLAREKGVVTIGYEGTYRFRRDM
jgi:hypothetical protein